MRTINADEISRRIEQVMENYLGPDESIINATRYITRNVLQYLHSELSGGKVFNIEPSRAKTPDDSAKKPGVSMDGSGLYSTLYALKY